MSIKNAEYERKRQGKFTDTLWIIKGHYITLHYITCSVVWPLQGRNQMVDFGWCIVWTAVLCERNIVQTG